MRSKLPAIAAVIGIGLLGLTGCGASSDDPPADHSTTMPQPTAPTASAPSTDSPSTTSDEIGGMSAMVMVDIKDFRYDGSMSVTPGQTVMVTNDDAEAHTLTSDDAGTFAVTVQPGATAMFDAPTKPGSYAYHCDFHANMHGSLVVS